MKLGYIVVYVANVGSVLAFYRDAFALPIRVRHEIDGTLAYAELETRGAILGFAAHRLGEEALDGYYQPVSYAGMPFGQTLVFVVDDVAGAFARAVAAGAREVTRPARTASGQVVARVRAIEGTLIELSSPATPAALPGAMPPAGACDPDPARTARVSRGGIPRTGCA